MDLFSLIRKHPWWFSLFVLILVIIVPFGIDKVFSTSYISSIWPILSVSYKPEDILPFYGIILGSITTIIALIETIQHTEKMNALDYKRKLTPLLNSNIYNHSSTSKEPLRILYVNTRPILYFDRVAVMDGIDPRDLDYSLFCCQIDYLVQNVSNTSAIDIRVFLNGELLHGPFSLVAGSEESIGICFLDAKGKMIDSYPKNCTFDIEITYSNSDKCEFKQSETIGIEYHLMRNDNGPIMSPDYNSRTGLSSHI